MQQVQNSTISSAESELVECSRKAMIFAVQLLGNQTEAEDVVQSSVVKALAHPSAPKGGVDLQKWLYRVVRNASIDRIRQQTRETEELEQAPSQADCPEKHLQQTQLKDRIQIALANLSAGQRELIVLRDYHGCSYEEISEILVIPQGTVMSRLHRARMNLRHSLQTERETIKERGQS